jgi:hypothetical protein
MCQSLPESIARAARSTTNQIPFRHVLSVSGSDTSRLFRGGKTRAVLDQDRHLQSFDIPILFNLVPYSFVNASLATASTQFAGAFCPPSLL